MEVAISPRLCVKATSFVHTDDYFCMFNNESSRLDSSKSSNYSNNVYVNMKKICIKKLSYWFLLYLSITVLQSSGIMLSKRKFPTKTFDQLSQNNHSNIKQPSLFSQNILTNSSIHF